jgi:hypothetical protein
MSEWEPSARAGGLSILGRLIETVMTIRTTREVIGRALVNSILEIPNLHLLPAAKDRYYLAIAISLAPGKVSPQYLAQAIIQEDGGEAAREVLIASLLRELISPTPLIALLVNPNNLTATAARHQLNDATRRIGQDVVVLEATTEGEFEAAFAV